MRAEGSGSQRPFSTSVSFSLSSTPPFKSVDTHATTEQGAKVTAQYHTNPTALDGLKSQYGVDRLLTLKANVENEDQVSELFTNANKVFGPVQIVVVNHGYWPTEDVPVSRMTLKQWNSTISTDLTSCFLVCRGYLRNLEGLDVEGKEKACIVLIGSTAGKYGEAFHADYAASKSGESSTRKRCDVHNL